MAYVTLSDQNTPQSSTLFHFHCESHTCQQKENPTPSSPYNHQNVDRSTRKALKQLLSHGQVQLKLQWAQEESIKYSVSICSGRVRVDNKCYQQWYAPQVGTQLGLDFRNIQIPPKATPREWTVQDEFMIKESILFLWFTHWYPSIFAWSLSCYF